MGKGWCGNRERSREEKIRFGFFVSPLSFSINYTLVPKRYMSSHSSPYNLYFLTHFSP
jgi:hypothetical protein